MTKRLLIVFLLFGLQSVVLAQHIIEMNEDDIDMTILTWHYSKYEKSTDTKWFVRAEEGTGYFHCRFLFKFQIHACAFW